MSGPIYTPKGKALEYAGEGNMALNLYTGCPHRCWYCFAPRILSITPEEFWTNVRPRDGIVEKTRKQLAGGTITGKRIHLCFTCDPYPTWYDNSATREVIALLKEYGNSVQILTKGSGRRDFDLLGPDDWYGVTLDGSFVKPLPLYDVLSDLMAARENGIHTWVSFEPVVNAANVLHLIWKHHSLFDKVKIGKLNYFPSAIDWKKFGNDVVALCESVGLEYYIKKSLLEEMNK